MRRSPLALALLLACRATPPSAPTPPTWTLRHLGVAGWQLEVGSASLLVDPYFTRADVEDPKQPISSDLAAVDRHAPKRADVILVGHSHYDHLLDVPTIALRTGATVVGTESTARVARAAGVTAVRVVRPGETFVHGGFTIQAIRGLHSLIGVPSRPIAEDPHLPLAAGDYHEGGTLHYLVRAGGRSVLFVGTANFVEDALTGLRPDVAVVAVGLREKIPDYTCRLLSAVGRPRLVLANHFDAHWLPLGPHQMDLDDDGQASLARFPSEVKSCAPGTTVVIPTPFAPIAPP